MAWAENGVLEGNPAETPAVPKFPDDWELGTPDLVLDIGADYDVPANGRGYLPMLRRADRFDGRQVRLCGRISCG